MYTAVKPVVLKEYATIIYIPKLNIHYQVRIPSKTKHLFNKRVLNKNMKIEV